MEEEILGVLRESHEGLGRGHMAPNATTQKNIISRTMVAHTVFKCSRMGPEL